MTIRTILAILALTAGTTTAFSASFAPPTDEQINALIESVRSIKPPQDPKDREGIAAAGKARAEAATNGLKDISLAEASLAQIELLYSTRVLVSNNDATVAMHDRLGELMKAPGIPGARAAELRLVIVPPLGPMDPADRAKAMEERNKTRIALTKDALNHPGTVELIKSGKGEVLVGSVANLPAQAFNDATLLSRFETLITPDMSLEAVAGLRGLVSKVGSEAIKLDKSARIALLEKVAAAAEGAVAQAGTVGKDREALVKRVGDVIKQAKSSFARGEFLGQAAPEITFDWSSDPKLKSLSELKGNVVVVDFWATWCGPCIASFPHIREFAERYEKAGYPVRILGVTSLQGYHMKRSLDSTVKTERIDCKDDPAKEQGLMPSFMTDMNMNWTVVFSPDGCFNPNYGVNGIPHIALVDAAGKVRYNELRPHTPEQLKDFADKIDALLKEAGLKTPEPYAPAEKKVSSSN